MSHFHGVINLPSKFNGATIRHFRPVFPTNNGDTLPSMALALASIACPEAAARTLARGNELEPIDYPGIVFETVPWFEVPGNVDRLSGKIVLVGDLGELGDSHGHKYGMKRCDTAPLAELDRGEVNAESQRYKEYITFYELHGGNIDVHGR